MNPADRADTNKPRRKQRTASRTENRSQWCQKINRSHAHAHDSSTNHSHDHRASNGATVIPSLTVPNGYPTQTDTCCPREVILVQLLTRVNAVAPPVSPCLCPLSDVRSLCAPPRCVRVGTRPSPPALGPSWNVPFTSWADHLRSQQTPATPVVKIFYLFFVLRSWWGGLCADTYDRIQYYSNTNSIKFMDFGARDDTCGLDNYFLRYSS